MTQWCLSSVRVTQKLLLPITLAWTVVLADFDRKVLALDSVIAISKNTSTHHFSESLACCLLPVVFPNRSVAILNQNDISIEIAQQRQPPLQPEIEPLPRQEPRREPVTPTPNSPELIPDTPASPETVYINRIEVLGSTVFNTEEFDPIVKPLQGRSVTLQELRQAAQSITQLYLNEGYLTSRALAINNLELIEDGVAQIQIIEGSLEKIIIEGADKLEDYVRDRIELGGRQPLNFGNLENQLRLLKADPLIENIEASVRAGTKQGQSILAVRVITADPFVGNVSLDNYSPPSIGAERLGLQLTYRNPFGLGDEIGVAYFPRLQAIDSNYQLQFRYQAPVNPMNGTIELSTLIERSKIIEGAFEPFDIRAESERYSLNFRQPIIRTLREELALSFGFVYRDGQTFTFQGPTPFGFGPNADGISRTSVFELGQEYIFRQVSGAWGLRSLLRFGVGIFDATDNPSPLPDGQFFSWLAQVQRVQVINNDNLLIIQGDLQLSSSPLLPFEQFAIGGGQSVRGYRQNVRVGDNGFRFSVEDRITLVRNASGQAVVVVAPFFDMGYVWNNPNNPNFLPEQQFIAGLGLGLLLQPREGFTLRLDYAPPLIDLRDRTDNIQDDGFYFSINYGF